MPIQAFHNPQEAHFFPSSDPQNAKKFLDLPIDSGSTEVKHHCMTQLTPEDKTIDKCLSSHQPNGQLETRLPIFLANKAPIQHYNFILPQIANSQIPSPS